MPKNRIADSLNNADQAKSGQAAMHTASSPMPQPLAPPRRLIYRRPDPTLLRSRAQPTAPTPRPTFQLPTTRKINISHDFTSLERSVLRSFCWYNPDIREALEAQLTGATFVSRENNGAGFVTTMAADRSTDPIECSATMLSGVSAMIVGFQEPLSLTLYINDRYVDCLEGITNGDSTVGLDLTSLYFRTILRH